MIKLKTHSKPLNEFTDIDKFLVVPKKIWNEIEPGTAKLRINGASVSVRIYNIPCECVGKMHSHRLIDLREIWDKIGLKENEEVTVEL